MRFRFTHQLFSLAAVGVSGVLAVGALADRAIAKAAVATTEAVERSEVIRSQMTADMMHDAVKAYLFEALHAIAVEDHQTARAARAALSEHADIFIESLTEVRERGSGSIPARVDEVEPAVRRYLSSAIDLAQAAVEGGASSARIAGFREDYDELTIRIEALGDFILDDTREAATAAAEAGVRTRRNSAILAFVTALAAAALAWVIGRGVAGRVRVVVDRVQRLRETTMVGLGRAAAALARGDLAIHLEADDERLSIDVDDEIGGLSRSINGMIDEATATREAFGSMRDSLAQLARQADGLTAAARRGELEKRADVSGLQGVYGDVIVGFNATLAAVVTPIKEAGAVLDRVANKDLTVRVAGDYAGDHARITEALNTALDRMTETLTEVAATAAQVAAAASQVDTGSQTLAEGASEQAATLEEISSSLQELTSMVAQNAGNATEGRLLAEAASTSTSAGAAAMERLSETVSRIKESSDATGKIVKTIDEIAFQTNLLALNAAVEAARAGESGKGFAVVAEEVRNLAMRSAEAAKETASLIEQSAAASEEGVLVKVEVVEQLDRIRTGVARVAEGMAEIAAASERQTSGVAEISGAVEEINTVTQRSAANSQESASAAEELTSQATRLRDLVAEFSLAGTPVRPGVRRPQESRPRGAEARALARL